ncbi:cell division control protein 42 homolog [Chironomus tepperi]|uniref:cell division control protein 42 homolog n=1 Tax=Chironomus tepperi TaxID=113505 RepID=UPI00391FB735
MDTINIVIIGDGTVGKTCLLHCYSNETFLESYVPTVYDKEDFDVMLNGKNYVLKLIDTAGQEDYERVRRLFYKDAKAFILCYGIENHASFNNIYNKWMPELKQIDNWPIPFILVGTKIDLRDDPTYRKPLITTEEGEGLAQRICANRFIECSAKKNVHIKDTIEEALRASFNGPIVENKKKDSCFTCCQS